MREIKFRGKCIANGEWVYGSLLLWPDGCCTILESKDGCNYVWKRDIDPGTVGQFTGMKDRNGKEIFEGDIVNYIVGRPRIFDREDIDWMQNTAVISMELKLVWTEILNPKTHYWDIDVIGNIHDNPELLKDEL